MTRNDKSATPPIDSFSLKPNAEVIERVRSFLDERLRPQGLDCKSIYINTVNNIVDLTLTYSQNLLGLGLDTLEWGAVQKHDDWETGIFSQSWTFDDSLRIDHPSMADIEQMMKDLLDEAKYEWMF